MKDRICALCGGELTERVELLVRHLPERGTILIRDVPAQVCVNCGHRWLAHAVMQEIEALLDGNREPVCVEQVPVFALRSV